MNPKLYESVDGQIGEAVRLHAPYKIAVNLEDAKLHGVIRRDTVETFGSDLGEELFRHAVDVERDELIDRKIFIIE